MEVLFLFLLWVLFNWLAPLVIKFTATRMHIGNVPPELLVKASMNKVQFYRAKLVQGYAFTVWCWPIRIVVIDEDFLKRAPADMVRFVLAHELGHILLGHTFRRWFSVVTGLWLFKGVRDYLAKQEESADKFAEELVGIPRAILSSNR